VLSRDGEWLQAADLLQRPAAGWPEGAAPEKVARAFKRALDQRLWLDFSKIPGAEANAGPGRVRIGVIEAHGVSMDVDLVRADGAWVFAAGTVEKVPAIAHGLGVWWVASLPPVLVDVRVAEIELWQWAGLVVIASLGIAAGWTVSRFIRRGAHSDAMRRLGPVAQSVVAVSTPLGVLLSLLAMRLAQPLLGLSEPARDNLALGSRALTVVVMAWAVARWLKIVTATLEEQMARRGITDATSIVRVGRAVATALVWLLGVAAALQIFGLDLSAVIAGLGIGTAAIALASQQTLANLFGGASVVADQVLNVGDTCRFDGTIATVERIGVRSTQLRTADRTLLIVANGDLAQSRIEKLSARDGFRHVVTLGLRYETSPEAMLAIVADLEKRMKEETLVDPASVMAHWVGFGDSSMNVEVRGMFRTLDMPTYRAAIQRLNADFVRIIARHGSGFAFPSRTVYMAQDGGTGKS